MSDVDQEHDICERRRNLRRSHIVVCYSWVGHLSHTTPSPSPSLALGTIHFGKPLPLPLLPCTRACPAAGASSQKLYDVIIGVGVGRAGMPVGALVGPARLWLDTINVGRFSQVSSISTRAVCSCSVTVRFQSSLMVIQ